MVAGSAVVLLTGVGAGVYGVEIIWRKLPALLLTLDASAPVLCPSIRPRWCATSRATCGLRMIRWSPQCIDCSGMPMPSAGSACTPTPTPPRTPPAPAASAPPGSACAASNTCSSAKRRQLVERLVLADDDTERDAALATLLPLQQRGQVVAMTASTTPPSWRRADIGVAMGGGTEVASQAAELVLVDDNLDAVTGAIGEDSASTTTSVGSRRSP